MRVTRLQGRGEHHLVHLYLLTFDIQIKMGVLRACVFLLLAPTAFAFAPHHQRMPATRPSWLRMMVGNQDQSTKAAFENVKAAAAMFPAGSESSVSALAIVARLESSTFESWQEQDLQLMDSCLVDDGAEGCEAFSKAMIDLRQIWDASPGNA